jgi:hypothetical protein
MLAQVILTPAESKKLISMAIASLDEVKKATQDGMIMMHPSSSTYFLFSELTGTRPTTNYWVCGVVAPRGTCVEMAMLSGEHSPSPENYDPRALKGLWAIKKGQVLYEVPLAELLDQMAPGDIYIKGVNALDAEGNVGILIGEPARGGALGVVMAAWRKKKFSFIYPVGLEKFIPGSVARAAREAKKIQYEYAMGLAAGLFPCPPGKTVTEITALEILSGVEAIPIAAGGLGGAEGATILVIKGTSQQVNNALEFVERAKGAKLPALRLCNCSDCPVPDCRFPVGDKHWA